MLIESEANYFFNFPGPAMVPNYTLAILFPALLLSGCASLPRYVISNNSDEIAVIDYSYPAYSGKDGRTGICPITQLGALPETTLGRPSEASTSWQKLTA